MRFLRLRKTRILISTISIAAIFLGSCVSSGNRLTATGKTRNLGEEGAVLLKFDRGPAAGDNLYELIISPIDPSTGLTYGSNPEGVNTTAKAIAGVTNPNWPKDEYWVFSLVPGDYAISQIRILPKSTQSQSPSYSSAFQGTPVPQGAGIAAVAILGVALVVLGGMAIAEAVKDSKRSDEDRVKNPRGTALFIDSDSEKRSVPKFRVEAGTVAYLGDITIEKEISIVDVVDNTLSTTTNETPEAPEKAVQNRTHVTYESDPDEARNYLAKVGLGAAPMREVHLSALTEDNINLVVFRTDQDPDDIDTSPPAPIGSVRVPTSKQELQPIKVTTTPMPTEKVEPTEKAKPLAKDGETNRRSLMRSFLSGEITKQEYDERRKALE
jgi:hypothetical protein